MNLSLPITNAVLEGARALLEGATYSLISFRNSLPDSIKKIDSVAIGNFESLQVLFVTLDYVPYISRVILHEFALKMPGSFFVCYMIGNLALLSVRLVLGTAKLAKNNIDYCAILRISSIAFNTLLLFYFKVHTRLLLIASAIGIAASLYTIAQKRKFHWLEVNKTVEDSRAKDVNKNAKATSQLIKDTLTSFTPQPPKSPQQDLKTGESLHFPSKFRHMSMFDNSAKAKHDKELEDLDEEIQIKAGDSIEEVIDRELKELNRSANRFYSSEIIRKRKERLFRLYDEYYATNEAAVLRLFTDLLVSHFSHRIQEAEFQVKILVENVKTNDEKCMICLEDNPNRRICENGHAFHEDCFREYVENNLDRLLPGNGNTYTLVHVDHDKKFHGIYQGHSHTEHRYKINISPKNKLSCPTCRTPIVNAKYSNSKVRDVYYGTLNQNQLEI